MNLRNTISRILNESVKDKMIEFIDSYGLLSAINFVGGWDELKEILGDYHVPVKDMIHFIKELAREYGGLSIFDFDEDPICYNQTETEYREISFFGTNTVVIQVWQKETFEDYGTFTVPYKDLDDETIVKIFELLIEEHHRGIKKI